MSASTLPVHVVKPSFFTRAIARHPLSTFFVLAFVLMWLPVLPMTLSRNVGVGLLPYELPDALALALYLVASLIGPTVAALVVTVVIEGRAGVARLLRRCVQWRVGLRWYGVAVSLNLVIWLLGYSVVVGPRLVVAAATHWSLLLTTFLPMFAFGILIPSIGEEPGWRGFALPRLQQRYGPLRGSLLLGALHGVWHLPALFTVMLGPFTLAQVAPFVLTAAATALLYTWIFNRTRGSVLLAILLHASGNAAVAWLTALFAQSGLSAPTAGMAGWLVQNGWLNFAAYGTAAVLVLVATRGQLGYETKRATVPHRENRNGHAN